jgi:hypothetical protein
MNGRRRHRQQKALSLDGRGLGEGEISPKSAVLSATRAVIAALIAATMAAATPAIAADASSLPAFLEGLPALVKVHDLRNVDAVSNALGLHFTVVSEAPYIIKLETKPDWLQSENYARYGVNPDHRFMVMSLQLARSAGCIKTEQVAAQLGHDYQLTPFQTNTQMGPGKVDAQQQFIITYKYPGDPPLKITFDPDHDHSGCFRSISMDSIPPK